MGREDAYGGFEVFFCLPAKFSSDGVEVQPCKLTKLTFPFFFVSGAANSEIKLSNYTWRSFLPATLHIHFQPAPFYLNACQPRSRLSVISWHLLPDPLPLLLLSPLCRSAQTFFSLMPSIFFLSPLKSQREHFTFYSDIFSKLHEPSSCLLNIYSWGGKIINNPSSH